MLKNTWVKWGLLVASSTLTALSLGACISNILLQDFVLRAVN